MKRRDYILLMAICIALLFAIYDIREREKYNSISTSNYTDQNAQSVSLDYTNYDTGHSNTGRIDSSDLERFICNCTHIVKAKYDGIVSAYHGEELVFTPLEEWKGTIGDEQIYIQSEDHLFQSGQIPQLGEIVVLMINRHISVYYPHDIYTVSGIFEYGSIEQEYINSVLDESAPTEREYYGESYTLSDNITNIINSAECIFVVKPTYVSAIGVYSPTVTYKCRVLCALQDQPVYKDIHIVFFQDDVKIAEEYLVLLNNVDNGTLYTLSSRNSVYSLEDAEEIEELKYLIDHAGEVTAPEEPTFEEILAAEKQAAGIE